MKLTQDPRTSNVEGTARSSSMSIVFSEPIVHLPPLPVSETPENRELPPPSPPPPLETSPPPMSSEFNDRDRETRRSFERSLR